MRSLALLRLVGGKDFWKSVRAASSCPAGVLEEMVWNIPNVSVPLGIGLCWVFPF